MITYRFTQNYGNRNTHHRSAYNDKNEGRADRKERKEKDRKLRKSKLQSTLCRKKIPQVFVHIRYIKIWKNIYQNFNHAYIQILDDRIIMA